ncbi:Hypothetical predicted protein [Paramuricea clavata]|uniref:Uncharacterized protein n=1 Tax=Paramuricea clavata TaxID=317549 RepID=A0A7D9I9Q9_PARCT|nr:Hypothetical predicted protein [Paramuricea clavata]
MVVGDKKCTTDEHGRRKGDIGRCGIRVEDVYSHNGISSDEESIPDDDMGEVLFNAEAEQLIDENADKDFFLFPSKKFFCCIVTCTVS